MTHIGHTLAAALIRAAHWIAGGHVYLSTACLHGRHGYCQSKTGSNPVGQTWVKNPAVCKFCKSPCTCPCHRTD